MDNIMIFFAFTLPNVVFSQVPAMQNKYKNEEKKTKII